MQPGFSDGLLNFSNKRFPTLQCTEIGYFSAFLIFCTVFVDRPHSPATSLMVRPACSRFTAFGYLASNSSSDILDPEGRPGLNAPFSRATQRPDCRRSTIVERSSSAKAPNIDTIAFTVASGFRRRWCSAPGRGDRC